MLKGVIRVDDASGPSTPGDRISVSNHGGNNLGRHAGVDPGPAALAAASASRSRWCSTAASGGGATW